MSFNSHISCNYKLGSRDITRDVRYQNDDKYLIDMFSEFNTIFTLPKIKRFLQIETDLEDEIIEDIWNETGAYFEHMLNIPLYQKPIVERFQAIPQSFYLLKGGDIAIDEIYVYGQPITDYILTNDGSFNKITLSSSTINRTINDTSLPLEINYLAGYKFIPLAIRGAINKLAKSAFDNRASEITGTIISQANAKVVDSIIRNYKYIAPREVTWQ